MAKILVIEDEPIIQDLIRMVLEPKGHEVIVTADGSEAVGLAKESEPDLVLLDIMLPGLDGFTIQNQFHEDEDLKGLPILMMTAKTQMEEVFKTSPNVVGFLAKPFSVKELTDKVNSVLKPTEKGKT